MKVFANNHLNKTVLYIVQKIWNFICRLWKIYATFCVDLCTSIILLKCYGFIDPCTTYTALPKGLHLCRHSFPIIEERDVSLEGKNIDQIARRIINIQWNDNYILGIRRIYLYGEDTVNFIYKINNKELVFDQNQSRERFNLLLKQSGLTIREPDDNMYEDLISLMQDPRYRRTWYQRLFNLT